MDKPDSSPDPVAVAPHPGSQEMPRWGVAELVMPPIFTWRNWIMLLGPGLLMAGSAIGGGEWLTGPIVTARYGGALLWLCTLSILSQVVYNMEICRYTLYTGEPIFTGKFRTRPGPRFWVWIYLLLDSGSILPYLAASAATPLAATILGRIPDSAAKEPVNVWGVSVTESGLLTFLGCMVFVLAMLPLIFGGKIYNALKAIMSFKIVSVFGFLLILGIGYAHWDSWKEIWSGFVKFGNVPVLANEDKNGNGKLDPGEDWDRDGHLDVVEEKFKPDVDTNNDGTADAHSDRNGDGKPDTFNDVDKDGVRDGAGVDNIFSVWMNGQGLRTFDWSMLGILCAMVAISGQGGLSNTPLSNYTRDQGWGMGYHVGAIPSVFGGHHLELSHAGSVFLLTPKALDRWKSWYRHVMRDQLCVWLPACFVGIGLPSLLSVEFLRRGTEASNTWVAAGMTAGGIQERVGSVSGQAFGTLFWYLTLLCGFLVLAPTMASTADGVVRRWVDVFWTSSSKLRTLDPKRIRVVYFSVLCAYAAMGLTMLLTVSGSKLLEFAGIIYNYAIAFSCWHTLAVNWLLLPKELRPGWFVRIAMFISGLFFFVIAGGATYALIVKYWN